MEERKHAQSSATSRRWDAVQIAQLLAAAFFAVAMLYLHYQQFQLQNYENGMFWSDNMEHLSLAMADYNYSLNSILFRWIYQGVGSLGCVLFVTFFDWLGIYTLRRLILQIYGRPFRYATVTALICYIAGPFCAALEGEIFRGSFGGALYFNVTYAEMRAFSFLALGCFLQLYQQIDGKIQTKLWAQATLWITLATVFKASFVFAFAPLLLLMLIGNLFRTGGKNLRNEVQIGCIVLPSIAACLWQAMYLYGDGSSSLAFSPLLEMSYWSKNYLFDLGRTYLFPVAALVCFARDWWKHFSYRFFWAFTCVAVLQALLLADVGRAAAGNMSWGACFATSVIIMVSLVLLLQMRTEKRQNQQKLPVRWFLCMLLFAGHAITGFVYLVQRLLGSGI